MTYLNHQILKSLKEARKRKGFSQRELSAKSGVPQSHISKIESGGVDLRVSSLVALARVLDLELELVPKKSIPAVKSIVRSSMNADMSEIHRRAQAQFAKFNDVVSKVSRLPDVAKLSKNIESVNQISRQLERLQPSLNVLQKIDRITKNIESAYSQNLGMSHALKNSEDQLKALRKSAAHPSATIMETKSAYNLDEVDDE